MMFILNSILLGIGLAMDAFSISVAAGLAERDMKTSRMCLISGTFGFFQMLMPLVGWLFTSYLASRMELFQRAVPYIALLLLLYIGGKMLVEGLRDTEKVSGKAIENSDLLLMGIATAIDALSVGFTMTGIGTISALAEAGIIGATTMAICFAGLHVGKKAAGALTGKATVLGGAILIFIGVEIFVKGVFF